MRCSTRCGRGCRACRPSSAATRNCSTRRSGPSATCRCSPAIPSGCARRARGDYKQRVDAASPDEIGALGREFNAMAAALDEREQRLIRSERLAAVGKIAAQITHEVRNPLSSIGLNAEMLEEETEGEAKKL